MQATSPIVEPVDVNHPKYNLNCADCKMFSSYVDSVFQFMEAHRAREKGEFIILTLCICQHLLNHFCHLQVGGPSVDSVLFSSFLFHFACICYCDW